MPELLASYPKVYAPLVGIRCSARRKVINLQFPQLTLATFKTTPILAKAFSLCILGASNTVLAGLICFYFLAPKSVALKAQRPHYQQQSALAAADIYQAPMQQVVEQQSENKVLNQIRVETSANSVSTHKQASSVAKKSPEKALRKKKTQVVKSNTAISTPSTVKVASGPAAGSQIQVGVPF